MQSERPDITDPSAFADEPALADLSDADALVGLPMPRCADAMRDESLRPRLAMRERRFPFPIPNGWFIVAASGELAPGGKRNLSYFGRELVAFRTKQGTPALFDAYCPHLGAHMGVGGVVEDAGIRCPFHGWRFDAASGRCTDVPYAPDEPVPHGARARRYPTIERNGFIWAWHHLEEGTPFYDVPEVPELSDPEWCAPVVFEFSLRTICQEMAENNHDFAHFKYVHGTDEIEWDDARIEGPYKRVDSRGGEFVRETFGLGLGLLRIRGFVTFLTSTTPIDEESIHSRWIFTAPNSIGGERAARAAGDNFMAGVSQDVPIWENKVYREAPMLTRLEKGIAEHRRWARQFYSLPLD